MNEIPLIESEELCKALEKSYSLSDMFRSRKPLRAEHIKTPVEHEEKFYVSFSGMWGMSKGEKGELIETMTAWGYRLWKPDEYQGKTRTFVEDGQGEYTGLLVIDPQGKEWVVGGIEICAEYQKILYPEQYPMFTIEETEEE